jgi:hypothetical protein
MRRRSEQPAEVEVPAILVNSGGTRCKGRTTRPTNVDSDVFRPFFIQFPAIGQIRCVNEMEAKAFSKEGNRCVYMETLRAYLDRTHEEISLLNGCLRRPLALPPANSVPAMAQNIATAGINLFGIYRWLIRKDKV